MRSMTVLFMLMAPALAMADDTPFDPAKYSQAVTDCDRLASHPDDPFSVAPGVPQADVDPPRAIEACLAAVKADPANPRLNYQLARVYGYSGQGELAYPHREAAITGNYPQALFVVGYLHLLGLNKQPQDLCRAGDLIRRSAVQGRLAGQVGFVRWVLEHRFTGCPVRQDWTEMAGFLAAAKQQAGGDYYKELLISVLDEQVQAKLKCKACSVPDP